MEVRYCLLGIHLNTSFPLSVCSCCVRFSYSEVLWSIPPEGRFSSLYTQYPFLFSFLCDSYSFFRLRLKYLFLWGFWPRTPCFPSHTQLSVLSGCNYQRSRNPQHLAQCLAHSRGLITIYCMIKQTLPGAKPFLEGFWILSDSEKSMPGDSLSVSSYWTSLSQE